MIKLDFGKKLLKDKTTIYVSSKMTSENYFTEIEQEEIINKFLDDININETEKLIKKELKKT